MVSTAALAVSSMPFLKKGRSLASAVIGIFILLNDPSPIPLALAKMRRADRFIPTGEFGSSLIRFRIARIVPGLSPPSQEAPKIRRFCQDHLSLESLGEVIQFRTDGLFKGRRIPRSRDLVERLGLHYAYDPCLDVFVVHALQDRV